MRLRSPACVVATLMVSCGEDRAPRAFEARPEMPGAMAGAGAPACLPPALASLPDVCEATSTPVRAALLDGEAPTISIGRTYGAQLPSTGPDETRGGAVAFRATQSGAHTLYVGTPNVPLRLLHDGVESSPRCTTPIPERSCGWLRRAFGFDLVAGTTYRLELGPLAPQRWVRLRLEPPAQPPLPRRLVLAAALEGSGSPDLYTIDEDGGSLRRLTTTGDKGFPRWSPNGEAVAYLQGGELFVADAEGGSARRVAALVGRDGVSLTAPAWAPDGSRLSYSYPRERFVVGTDDETLDQSYDTTLHLVAADGASDIAFREPAETTAPPGIGTLTEPSWSRTGWLTFRVADDCPDCAGGHVFAVARPDGSFYETLPAEPFGITYPRHDLQASPDGTRWLFTARSGSSYESEGAIAVSDLTGRNVTIVVASGARHPRWSPDGTRIAYLAADGLYVVEADGTGTRRIFAATDVRGFDW